MDYLDILKCYIPGTQANRDSTIQEGLDFAKKIADKHEYRQQPYKDFENAVRNCQRGDCPYSVFELREMSAKISPGLGCVGTIWHACSAAKN